MVDMSLHASIFKTFYLSSLLNMLIFWYITDGYIIDV